MERLACSAPEVVLAHVGARTERIRLGSGAVLLPHYKAIKVAETFHTLATLYPGRIDLGLGRAPGGSAHLSLALSGNFLDNVRRLPETLGDLMQLLAGAFELDGVPVAARPIPPSPPEVWLLGTNRKSAAYAAEFGTGFVFGQFMSDEDGADIIRAYRQSYRPSRLQGSARAIVAVGVICADTEEAAHQLAAEGARLFRPPSPPGQPELDAEIGAAAAPSIALSPQPSPKLLIGTPQQVRDRLEELARYYEVDEFLVVSHIADYAERRRSYERLLGPVE